ncbi:MAG: methyltransferase domain-containing protein [Ahniella sp.]|nr:methyltransferase domain-containing protein [Ahniella sp.]
MNNGTLMLAADALIRARAGRWLIHTTTSRYPAFVLDNPNLVTLLGHFVRPLSLLTVLAQVPPAHRAEVQQVLEHLQTIGVLVPADSPAAADPAIDWSAQRANVHLRHLARSVYDLGGDVACLATFAETELRERTGAGLERRLLAMIAAVDGLKSELAGLRDAFVGPQLAALGLHPHSRDLNLHLGAGPTRIDGFVNIDIQGAPLNLNLAWGLPFSDGSVQRIYVSHMLEHLFYPHDVGTFLREMRRVLAPGGRLRLAVPDIAACIEAYRTGDRRFFESRHETWDWWPKDLTPLESFLAYAGAGAEPGHLLESHKFGYDFETLAKALRAAGFDTVLESRFMQSEDPLLQVDSASAVASARHGEHYYALFVEAVRNP